MLITDPQQDDNPIVFANQAFTKLTGFDRADVIGRNCRFLQGDKTDRAEVARLRQAITDRMAIELELLNYRHCRTDLKRRTCQHRRCRKGDCARQRQQGADWRVRPLPRRSACCLHCIATVPHCLVSWGYCRPVLGRRLTTHINVAENLYPWPAALRCQPRRTYDDPPAARLRQHLASRRPQQ